MLAIAGAKALDVACERLMRRVCIHFDDRIKCGLEGLTVLAESAL